MKKILHICLNGSYTEGFNYQDNMLSKYHKHMGMDVTLFAPQWYRDNDGILRRTEQTDYVNDNGVRVFRLKQWKVNKKPNNRLKIYPELYKLIEHVSPDIIFLHNLQMLNTLTISKYLKKNSDVKLFIDNHADFSNSATNWLSKNILHSIIWKCCAHVIEPYTEKFYGVLPARVDFLKNVYGLPEEKCELLVMGADDEKAEAAKNPKVRENIRSRYGIEKDDFLIMTGGKIDQWKTQTLLLMEAVAKIDNHKVKLLVFGSITSDLKEKFNSLCITNKVIYVGWIAADDSYSYVEAADLLVFGKTLCVLGTSLWAGKPMLIKYWDGTTHVNLGGNVEFLYQDSTEEILEKIIELLDAPSKYQAMKSVAEDKGKEVFSYRKIAERSISMQKSNLI